jgi:UDP-N-acetylglucosamine--N-acetylmuramyl-(pentapeptide) pyrophosphoryl-undecaprenol N-acetylglucosamine transferase
MERAGAAIVLPDSALGDAAGAERLRAEVAGILGEDGKLEAMAAASRSLAKPDAARRIADEVLAAAGAGSGHGAEGAR